MNRIFTAASLVALLAIPAFAQDTTSPSPSGDPASAQQQDAAPAPAADPAPSAAPDAAPADKAASPEASIPDKSAALGGEMSASDLLNKKVMNPENDTIGNVNDLSIGGDGKIAALIVGVGGFLGMGEKNVSLPYDQLSFSRDSDGSVIVTANVTKESLQSAPEWTKPDRT